MEKAAYILLENYMHSCMMDSAHDSEHIYRVLYVALDIAETEKNVDHGVLISACLLHDIGRKEQFEDPKLCHARVGAEKARKFLLLHGFAEDFAEKVSDCVRTHRFRNDDPPCSLEAKILFDADKIDVCGALGIARTLLYKGAVSEPLYSVLSDGRVSDGADDCTPSFFQEYRHKLVGIHERLFTARGREIAAGRQEAATTFYNSLLHEVGLAYSTGQAFAERYLNS